MPTVTTDHPLVIVGAGPIGLAAAAHAQSRGLPTVVLESGDGAGRSGPGVGPRPAVLRLERAGRPRRRGAARRAPAGSGPTPATYPTGAEWVDAYLAPLAEALAATGEVEVRYGHRVVGVAKQGRDRMVDSGREDAPFTVHVRSGEGTSLLTAGAVIDASGTWYGANPLGARRTPRAGRGRARRPHHLRHPRLHRPRHPRPVRRQARRRGRPRRLGPEHPGRA